MPTLNLYVVPNAKSDIVVGQHGDAIKIKLRAPAVEAKANSALCSFLAQQLDISRHAIVLEHGHKSRDKVIRIDDVTEQEVRKRLRVAT